MPAPSSQWFDGYPILEEVGDVAVALFQWYRDLTLWTAVGNEQSRDLFNGGSEIKIIESPLEATSGVFGKLLKGEIQAEELCAASLQVAEWATGEGYSATAALFAEAAARLFPGDPDLAFRAGRANRHNIAHDRAVVWFQRGIGMARRSGNWPSYVDCWLGWGNLEISRGRYGVARRYLNRAFRAARKYNLRELGGAAQHDLFMLAVDQRQFDEAYRHAAVALELHDVNHASFPFLAHDLAQTWALDGYGSVALPILQAVRKVIDGVSAQIQIAGNIAGAAGLAGDLDAFFEAWDVVSNAATRPMPYVAAALASVAEGAFALKLHKQAAESATKALRIAREREEPTEERRAADLLTKLRNGEPPPSARPPPKDMEALASMLLQQLSRRADR